MDNVLGLVEKNFSCCWFLTSLISPVTVPLKTALAIVHCPSVSLSAEMSAHLILKHKCTERHKSTNKMSKLYSNPAGLTFRIFSFTMFCWVILNECSRLRYLCVIIQHMRRQWLDVYDILCLYLPSVDWSGLCQRAIRGTTCVLMLQRHQWVLRLYSHWNLCHLQYVESVSFIMHIKWQICLFFCNKHHSIHVPRK